MAEPPADDFVSTLARARQGDALAAEALFPLVYGQLRRMAGGYFRGQAAAHTLQPTALVHEAFLRLCQRPAPFADRAHFVAVAATAMRQVLIDHARKTAALKRGGDQVAVTLDDVAAAASSLSQVDVLALDAALTQLAALAPRQARLVELYFFGGMTVEEAAEILGLSVSLVEKELRRARAWIRAALSEPDPGAR